MKKQMSYKVQPTAMEWLYLAIFGGIILFAMFGESIFELIFKN